MTIATGIHAHPTRKLGKRPPKRAATLRLSDFLKAVPDHPAVDLSPLPPGGYPVDFNDVAGCCVVAAADHLLQAAAFRLGAPRKNWTSDQLLAHYRTQNPDFRSWSDGGGPADGGMDEQTFLEHLVHDGTILAFGAVDLSEEMLKAAEYVGLGVMTGEMLTVAQQNQYMWDYVPGDEPWGGHATVTVGYQGSPDQQSIVTWGQLVPVTEKFVAHQVEEAWFVLTADLVNHAGFRNHFDLPGFAAAVAELTGGKVVVPVDPPAPAPSPSPAPVPAVDPLADFPFAALDHWAGEPHVWRPSRIAAQQYEAWKARHHLSEVGG